MSEELKKAVELLHAERCSCVVISRGKAYEFHLRGVRDLYNLLSDGRNLLEHAAIADKVVGKGAAALMITGGVDEVYADVISEPALELFKRRGMKEKVGYGTLVPNIINRAGTGLCPVETRCMDIKSAEECLPPIISFLSSIQES